VTKKTAEIIKVKVNEIDCTTVTERDYNNSSSELYNPYCDGILKNVKSARIIEIAKSSSIPSDDSDNLVWIIVGASVGAGIIISVTIVAVSVVCHKKKATKNSDDCEVIVANGSVYVPEDGVVMTEFSAFTSTPDPSSSKPESDVTIFQAFEE